MERSPPGCPVCTGAPAVVVAVDHDTLRRLILELLEQDRVSWQLHAVADRRDLAAAVSAAGPDLVVLADGDLGWCFELLSTFAPQRVIVIGPEPDPAYECAARRAGAGAWLSTDRIGDDLIVNMRRVLGCTHDPCRPAEPPERLSPLIERLQVCDPMRGWVSRDGSCSPLRAGPLGSAWR